MRQRMAKFIVFTTSMLVLLLASIFAYFQNPKETNDTKHNIQEVMQPTLADSTSLERMQIKRGEELFTTHRCIRCHSMNGIGSTINPLDHVAKKMNKSMIINWITGGDALKGKMPEYLFNSKQKYKKLPADELDALVMYIQKSHSEEKVTKEP